MSRIYVGCEHSSGILGKAIRLQTRSEVNHTLHVIDGVCFEANGSKGVTARRWDSLVGRKIIWLRPIESIERALTADQIREAYDFAYRQEGKSYDWTMVLRFVSRRQSNRTDNGKWFCSEFTFATLAKIGINLLERIEPWAVSPQHVLISPLLEVCEEPPPLAALRRAA